MDVRTQKNTLILLTDSSGFHVEDLHSLTKRFPSLHVWQLHGCVEWPALGQGVPLALVDTAAQVGRAGDLCPEPWWGHRSREGRAVVLDLQDSSERFRPLICCKERQRSSLFEQRWMGELRPPDGVQAQKPNQVDQQP